MILFTTPFFFAFTIILKPVACISEKGESRLICYSYRVRNFRNTRNWTVAIINTKPDITICVSMSSGYYRLAKFLVCFHNNNTSIYYILIGTCNVGMFK